MSSANGFRSASFDVEDGIEIFKSDASGTSGLSINPSTVGIMLNTAGGTITSGVNSSGQRFSFDNVSGNSMDAGPDGINLGGTSGTISFSANGQLTIQNGTGDQSFDADSGTLTITDTPSGNTTVITSSDISTQNLTVEKVTASVTDPLVAESFLVMPGVTYQAGDVLVIDPHGSGRVTLSSEAEDTGVVGVVAPGVTVDENGEILVTIFGAHGPIRPDGTRLVGVVNVDASYGSIQAGDLLTTSPTPGHAMKAEHPKFGTIVGKALEPFGQGQGEIRVFITLQ